MGPVPCTVCRCPDGHVAGHACRHGPMGVACQPSGAPPFHSMRSVQSVASRRCSIKCSTPPHQKKKNAPLHSTSTFLTHVFHFNQLHLYSPIALPEAHKSCRRIFRMRIRPHGWCDTFVTVTGEIGSSSRYPLPHRTTVVHSFTHIYFALETYKCRCSLTFFSLFTTYIRRRLFCQSQNNRVMAPMTLRVHAYAISK